MKQYRSAAARFFWDGAMDAFDYAITKKYPDVFGDKQVLKKAIVFSGKWREGKAYKASVIDVWRNKVGFFSYLTHGAIMLDEIASEAANKSNQSMQELLKTVDEFRGSIKNDLASMKAASDRVETEVRRMSKSYAEAAQALTSSQFTAAVENAERLAAALEKISQLRGQRIDLTFLAEKSEAA